MGIRSRAYDAVPATREPSDVEGVRKTLILFGLFCEMKALHQMLETATLEECEEIKHKIQERHGIPYNQRTSARGGPTWSQQRRWLSRALAFWDISPRHRGSHWTQGESLEEE